MREALILAMSVLLAESLALGFFWGGGGLGGMGEGQLCGRRFGLSPNPVRDRITLT